MNEKRTTHEITTFIEIDPLITNNRQITYIMKSKIKQAYKSLRCKLVSIGKNDLAIRKKYYTSASVCACSFPSSSSASASILAAFS